MPDASGREHWLSTARGSRMCSGGRDHRRLAPTRVTPIRHAVTERTADRARRSPATRSAAFAPASASISSSQRSRGPTTTRMSSSPARRSSAPSSPRGSSRPGSRQLFAASGTSSAWIRSPRSNAVSRCSEETRGRAPARSAPSAPGRERPTTRRSAANLRSGAPLRADGSHRRPVLRVPVRAR